MCRVNKLKYPDECLAKVFQLKNVGFREVYDHPEFKYNQQRNYERYLFVSNKYMPEKKNKKLVNDRYDDYEFEETQQVNTKEGKQGGT